MFCSRKCQFTYTLAVVCCCALHADRYVVMTLIDDAAEIGDFEPCSKVKTVHATPVYTYRQQID